MSKQDEIKIIIADDEKIIRDLLIHLLEILNFTVFPASNAKEALQIFAAEKDQLRLVITDIIMPGMNGIKLARKIQKERPDISIIFISGDESESSSILEQDLCNTHFIKKPFKLAEVKAKVLAVLKGSDA